MKILKGSDKEDIYIIEFLNIHFKYYRGYHDVSQKGFQYELYIYCLLYPKQQVSSIDVAPGY